MIPKQLQIRGIRFVLLEKSGKKPFQNNWQNKEIEYDDTELKNHIEAGGNYGVMGGGKKSLIIIDFDNERIQNQVVPLLPKTFTVKTGTGKLHKYFFSEKCDSFKIFDEDMNTLADVQGEGKQVVGVGSIHPNGKKYEIVDDSGIANIPYAEVKALLMKHDKKPKKEEPKQERKTNFEVQDGFIDSLKNILSMRSVLASFGIDTTKNPTECLFHSSNGGKCLGYNNETAHCFHCDGSWNIFSFVKEAKNCGFKEALEYLANLAGLEDDLQKSRENYRLRLKEINRSEKRNLKEEFLDLIKDKKISSATELIVDYIKRNNYIYTTKDDQKTEMWIYRDGIYSPNGKSEVKEVIRDILGKWYNTYYFNQVINKLEADTFIEIDAFFQQRQTEEIPLENGLLNIYTREIKEFTPDKIFFNKLPVEYNPLAECPKVEQFLKDVLANEEDINVFYELGGFILLNDYRFEKAFMFVGDGRNGKDKTLELIKRLVGVENCCSVPLSSLTLNDFIVSELFGKRVNLAGDIDNKDLKDTSGFKALTGRSLISAQRKYLQPITFQNNAKFVFACNELPMVYDMSFGFWDRWILLEFPYTFVTQEELDKAKDKDKLKLKDENIIDKISSPHEMSGLLNKFLDGLDRLLQFKTFSQTKGTEEIKNTWIRKASSFMAFCLDFIEADYDSFISKKELRKKYNEYCKKHRVSGKSDYVIKRTLEEMFGAVEVYKNIIENVTNRVWEGIKWK